MFPLPSRPTAQIERYTRRPGNCLPCCGKACNVSAHQTLRRGRERGNLGDQFLDDGAAERVEVLGHQNERARAADHVVLVVFLEAARRIGMLGVPRHRPVAQDDEPIDDDPFGNGLIARKLYVTARIVGAVAGDVYGTASGAEWGTLQLSEAIPGADRRICVPRRGRR